MDGGRDGFCNETWSDWVIPMFFAAVSALQLAMAVRSGAMMVWAISS